MLAKLGAQPAGGDPRVRYFRALVALRRADLHAARAHLDAALGPRPSRISLLGRSEPLTQARALRAFVRAAQGDTAGAVDDAGAVRSDREADASSLAFAALAEAVVLERRGDRPGLRAHLAEHRPLLLGATGRRERAIVRAYQRMLERPATSVYREGGGQALGAGGAEASLTAWVSRVAPGAAPFLRAAAPGEGASGASKAGPTEAPPRPARATSRHLLERLAWLAFGMLLGGAVLVVAFMAAGWGGAPSPPTEIEAAAFVLGGVAALATLLSVSVARRLAFVRRDRRLLAEATTRMACGDVEGVEAVLARESMGTGPVFAARAALLRGLAREQSGDLEGALRLCDGAVVTIGARYRTVATLSLVLPTIHAERAFLLAALGRAEEASRVLDATGEDYPFLEAARLSMRLAGLSREGRFEEAARLLDEASPDLTQSRSGELLAGVVRAIGRGGVASAEVRDELRRWPGGRRWLEAVAPRALAAFDALGADVGEAEREARSEAEAIEEEARGLRYLAP